MNYLILRLKCWGKILLILNSGEAQDHQLVKATKFRMAMVEEVADQIETEVPIGVVITKIEGLEIGAMATVGEAEASDQMMVDTEENNKIEALIKERGAPISEDTMKIIKESPRETLVLIDKRILGRDHALLTGSTIIDRGTLLHKPNKYSMTMSMTRFKMMPLLI